MTAAEFGHWQAFLAEEPIGPAAGLLNMAHMLAALANGPLKPPQGRPCWRAADFLPDLWRPPKEEPPQTRQAHAKSLKSTLARMVPQAKQRKRNQG